jgi:hypothetical protein
MPRLHLPGRQVNHSRINDGRSSERFLGLSFYSSGRVVIG